MSEPGYPNAAVLRLALWEAMRRCDNDDRIHEMETPCFNRVDADGGDQLVDGFLPSELWQHMVEAIADLREATAGEHPQ